MIGVGDTAVALHKLDYRCLPFPMPVPMNIGFGYIPCSPLMVVAESSSTNTSPGLGQLTPWRQSAAKSVLAEINSRRLRGGLCGLAGGFTLPAAVYVLMVACRLQGVD